MSIDSAPTIEARPSSSQGGFTSARTGAYSWPEQISSVLKSLVRSPRRLFAALLVLVALLLTAYFVSKNQTPAITYRTAEVRRGAIVSVISASGTLRPATQVAVVAQAPGQVAAVVGNFNDHVKAGDVLARLKSDVAEARLQMATADLEVARGAVDVARGQSQRAQRDVDNARASVGSAKADVDRADLSLGDASSDLRRKQELARTGDAAKVEQERAKSAYGQAGAGLTSAKARQSASAAALASAQAAVVVSQAQEKNAVATLASREAAVRQAQLDLDQTYIRAPIDGVVIDRNAVVGQSVAAGAGAPPLFVIANDLRQLEVHASIDEADIGRIATGQDAKFTFDAFPGQQFTGSVLEIRKTPQVAQNVVSYDVVLSAENDDLKLLPGMTADVRIIAGSREDVLKVPNSALRFRPATAGEAANSPTVWHLHNGEPQAVLVHTGLSDGTETEIVSGNLTTGEKIVVGTSKATGATADRASVGPLKF